MVDENVDGDSLHSSEDKPMEISSQASEFVDATQIIEEEESVSNQGSSQLVPTPVRIQKDMNFLKVSWANLAELEENDSEKSADRLVEERLIDEAQQNEDQRNIEASGFLLVTNRNKKKNKSPSVSKSSYTTRSRAGHPKPFK